MSETARLRDGYAHELPPGQDWQASKDDDWDTVMIVPSEAEGAAHVGRRAIDGSPHNVFRTADGRHAAQLVHYA